MFRTKYREYITFSVPIKKELDSCESIKYKIKFTETFRFMSKSLSSLVKYLSGRIHSDKCIDCRSHLDHMSVKDGQLIFRCVECKKYIYIYIYIYIRKTLITN